MLLHAWAEFLYTCARGLTADVPPRCDTPFGALTHEAQALKTCESPRTLLFADTWAQTQHSTCDPTSNATGFDKIPTYCFSPTVWFKPPWEFYFTPGTLKAVLVALVKPVAYLKVLVKGWQV
jgi:hypothetical protein